MNNKKITLVIPCLNEEDGLSKLLPTIPNFIDQILIVDGASLDNTVKVAKKFGADVIVEPERGYGLALRRGFDASKNEILMTFDGDGTYPVDQLESIYQYFVNQKLDFVVACRFPLRDRRSMAVRNFFGNLFISSITSLVYNYQVTDICSGMWVMTKKTWKQLKPTVTNKKWFFSNEIKIAALKQHNITYDEYPITLETRSGQTKVGNVWMIGLEVLSRTILKKFSK